MFYSFEKLDVISKNMFNHLRLWPNWNLKTGSFPFWLYANI